jgi:hypothetical protein
LADGGAANDAAKLDDVKLQLEKKERDIDSLKSKFDREESRCHG